MQIVPTLSIMATILLVPAVQDSLVAQNPQERDAMTEALEASPGCLGVKTIEHNGEKITFVWFKDRESVIAWCKNNNHQMAQGVLKMADPKFEIRDPLFPANGGAFTLSVSEGRAAISEGTQSPPIRMDVQDFAPLFSGFLRAELLQKYGRLECDEEKNIARASAALAAGEPWMSDVF